MICPPCREGNHVTCPEIRRLAGNPDLPQVQRIGGQLCDCLHKERNAGAAAGSVRGQSTQHGECASGPGVVTPSTHWWFDHDRWVGSQS